MSERNRLPYSSARKTVVLLALACCLASCAPKKAVDTSAYRDDAARQTPQASAPESPTPPPRQSAPEPQAAIPPPPSQPGVLFTNANKAMQAGQLDRAEMQLERALRLAPRDPQLWHAMANLRFRQSNYAQAIQFCLKSNSLAGRNKALLRRNWLLLEKAYLKMGQKEKAADARRKADE